MDAAHRLLGSDLLAAALTNAKSKPHKASTACPTIDDALEGGFDYGLITSIAGKSQADKTLLALHAIAGHLLRNESTDVAFVYTSESGLPAQLAEVLCSRLVDDRMVASQDDEMLHAKVVKLLERVRLMRAFDFIGVLESVGEISEAWSETDKKQARDSRTTLVQALEVLDSEDEAEDEASVVNGHTDSAPKPRGIGMIVIDNIASVLSTEMAKDQIEGRYYIPPCPSAQLISNSGQALMASFFSSLHSITTQFNICSLIINTTVAPSIYHKTQQVRPEERVSIFSSVAGKPGLGHTYAHLVDVSLFLSEVPKTRDDAEAAYARTAPHYLSSKVLEVLDDRLACRDGSWAAFDVHNGITLTPYV
jgi:RecA/RadA recombinase